MPMLCPNRRYASEYQKEMPSKTKKGVEIGSAQRLTARSNRQGVAEAKVCVVAHRVSALSVDRNLHVDESCGARMSN